MLERNISTAVVELVISEPDGKIQQSQDKFIYFKNIKSRTDNQIAVVTVLKSKNVIEVLTVMINFEVQQ